jgi:putative flippase GtrA
MSGPDAQLELVNIRELFRFLLTGVVATLGNLTMVWAVDHFVAYQWSLLLGLSTGFSISFLMSKLFAFRSRTWRNAHHEAGRFMLVYGVGSTIYWCVSMVAGTSVLPHLMPKQYAHLVAVIIGAGIMTFTSYFGHRFFTYRRRTAVS